MPQLGPAGFGPDRFGPNGFGPDGFGPDRFGPDRLGCDRLGPDRFGHDSVGPDVFGPDRLGPDGFGPDGFGTWKNIHSLAPKSWVPNRPNHPPRIWDLGNHSLVGAESCGPNPGCQISRVPIHKGPNPWGPNP